MRSPTSGRAPWQSRCHPLLLGHVHHSSATSVTPPSHCRRQSPRRHRRRQALSHQPQPIRCAPRPLRPDPANSQPVAARVRRWRRPMRTALPNLSPPPGPRRHQRSTRPRSPRRPTHSAARMRRRYHCPSASCGLGRRATWSRGGVARRSRERHSPRIPQRRGKWSSAATRRLRLARKPRYEPPQQRGPGWCRRLPLMIWCWWWAVGWRPACLVCHRPGPDSPATALLAAKRVVRATRLRVAAIGGLPAPPGARSGRRGSRPGVPLPARQTERRRPPRCRRRVPRHCSLRRSPVAPERRPRSPCS